MKGLDEIKRDNATRPKRSPWIAGPPPGRGSFWIFWYDKVLLVDIGPALLFAHLPDAALLIKLIGGAAYPLATIKRPITHHMPVVAPEAP